MSQKLPSFEHEFTDWYNEVIFRARLADHAPVRGCMVICPYGYELWEKIVHILDEKIKRTGHKNAAFPLLIPESFLKKEADHVAGFSPELAVVTQAGGELLEEPLVVRPTSETIIHYMFAQWIKSWRDLPLKINQWASVIRWEKRARPFLRTTEFWWQEGHTAHETEREADEEVLTMLEEYRDLAERYLAIPVVTGRKTDSEKFAGANYTYTIEGLMPDGKALQMGTSHSISQSFARSFNMTFQNREGTQSHPYLTSWGATTRLIGALVMTHGDDKGLIIPPKVAPYQIMMTPIFKADTKHLVIRTILAIAEQLTPQFRVTVDLDDQTTPGAKYYESELKGIPLRIELGARDIESNKCILVNRLTGEKISCSLDQLIITCASLLEEIQESLFQKALERRNNQWYHAASYAELAEQIEQRRGFYQISWCGSRICEASLKQIKMTGRCIIDQQPIGPCYLCRKESQHTLLAARAY